MPDILRRLAPRNKDCNNRHGKVNQFLIEKGTEPWEAKANQAVIIPQEKIPPAGKGR
jgi:hypothetical protein